MKLVPIMPCPGLVEVGGECDGVGGHRRFTKHTPKPRRRRKKRTPSASSSATVSLGGRSVDNPPPLPSKAAAEALAILQAKEAGGGTDDSVEGKSDQGIGLGGGGTDSGNGSFDHGMDVKDLAGVEKDLMSCSDLGLEMECDGTESIVAGARTTTISRAT